MADQELRSPPHAAPRKSITAARWLAIPIAVLLGLATRYAGASLFGEAVGDYLGFAITLMSVSWLLAYKDRSKWGVNAALSALAGVVGVMILFILRYLSS